MNSAFIIYGKESFLLIAIILIGGIFWIISSQNDTDHQDDYCKGKNCSWDRSEMKL